MKKVKFKFLTYSSVYSGAFEVKKELSNDYVISFEAFNLSGGQYKKIFGNTLGNACDVIYEKSLEDEVKTALTKTNSTLVYGTCPIPAQVIQVNDYTPVDAGDLIPAYMPGNERWKLSVWVSKDNEIISGATLYAILRDEQKLFDSKW